VGQEPAAKERFDLLRKMSSVRQLVSGGLIHSRHRLKGFDEEFHPVNDR
jgi:hypothetical protein